MTHRVSQWKEALHRHCYMTTTAAARGAAAVGTQLDGTVIIITRQCWCLLLLWHSSTEAAAASMAVHSVAHRSRWLLARVSNRCRQETTKHLRSKHGDHLTIYKRRRQFFDTPLPIPAVFLVLSVGNFDPFLNPSPSQLPPSFMDGPTGKHTKLLACLLRSSTIAYSSQFLAYTRS